MKSVFLILLALRILFPSGSAVEAEKIFGKEYFPQTSKAKMLFDSNLGETTLNISTKENKSQYIYESGSITYKQTFRFTEKGIFLLKTESKALFFGNTVYYKKPVLRLPFPMSVGQKWTWSGYEYRDEDDSSAITFSGEVVTEEEIKTPAGRFQVIKVKTKIRYSSGEYDYLTEWYAPNVGLVKLEANGKASGIAGLIKKLFGLQTITFELKKLNV